MENATKALLIAGAILIALIFIGIGIGFANSGSGNADQFDSNMESVSATNFNAQFLPYISNSTSASKVKSLVKKVMAHNVKVSTGKNFSAENHQVHLNLYDKNGNHLTKSPLDPDPPGHNYTSAQLQDIYNKISDTKKYKIAVTTGCETYSDGYYNGYLICLSISER